MRLFALAIALSTSCAAAASTPVGGWVSYWDPRAGAAGVAAGAGRLSDVFLFAVHLDQAGDPVPARPREDFEPALAAARAAGATTWLTVVNDVASPSGRVDLKVAGAVHDVLAEPARRRVHREKLVALARAWGVDGVDVDFERLDARDRDLYSAFVAELGDDLRRAGLRLSVTVQPRTRAGGGAGAGTADWAALCRSADRLQIMLYNEHGARTAAGPIATASWAGRVLDHALERCPADRIVAAIKVIGMEWSPEGTRDLSYARASALARQWRAEVVRHRDGDVPWFTYGPEGARRTVYFEDARSLDAKVRQATRLGVRGVVLWTLGAEDPAFWDLQRRQSATSPPPTDP